MGRGTRQRGRQHPGIWCRRATILGGGLVVLALSVGTPAGSATTVPAAGEFAASASARAVSLVYLRRGFVVGNPVDLHFGSTTTAFDGGPSYSAIADPVDPGFAKRAGGVAATVGVPIAIPDWPFGAELTTGTDQASNKPVAGASPDGVVAIEAIPAEATASKGPGGRVDASAAVTSLRVGMPGKAPAPPAPPSSGLHPGDGQSVAASLWRAEDALRSIASRRSIQDTTGQEEDSNSLLQVGSAKAVSGSGWSGESLAGASAADLSQIALLGGTIRFASVRSSGRAHSELDGRSIAESAVIVGAARVGDIPVTVDRRGVRVNEQALGEGAVGQLQQRLEAALTQAGVRIRLVDQVRDGGSSRGTALEVAVRLADSQFREDNEFAFRLGTVDIVSSLNPQSLAFEESSVPIPLSSPVDGYSPEPASTEFAGSEPPGTAPTAPFSPGGGSDSSSTVPMNSPGSASGGSAFPASGHGQRLPVTHASDAGGPSMPLGAVGSGVTGDGRGSGSPELAASSKAKPLSKSEAQVLLVLLGGQAALAVLLILRRLRVA
jgi:hypothetical protein